ncbi:MAG: ParB N-terminal domain-containing protein [Planctomycetota bacterium]
MSRKQRTPEDTGLGYIAEQLRPLALPLAELKLDPRNARKHSEANLQAIVASLETFGQLKPIVVHAETRVIEAGNGTFAAAERLGWTHLACVLVKHDAAAARGFALADNRTAELAEWDPAVLESLLSEVEKESPDLWAELLLAELLPEDADPTEDEQPEREGGAPKSDFQIMIECDDVRHRDKLLGKLRRQGLRCRSVTWR